LILFVALMLTQRLQRNFLQLK